VGFVGAAVLFSLALQAGTLQYSGSTSTEGYAPGNVDLFFDKTDAHSNDLLLVTRSFGPDSTHVASFAGEVAFGHLGSYSSAGGSAISSVPNAAYSASLGTSFTETFSIFGPASGFLALAFDVHGVMHNSSGPDDQARASLTLITFNSTGSTIWSSDGLGLNWLGSGSPSVASSPGLAALASAVSVGPNSGGIGFNGHAVVLIPFSENTFNVKIGLNSSVSCHLACSATSDFLNTAVVGGARILDSSMNEIPGATLTAESGFDYQSQSTPTSDVPEPATVFLTGAALAVLVWRSRSRVLTQEIVM
jgi:hypothetical protein